MPAPLIIAAIVGGAVAGAGAVSAASRKIYKRINGEIIYLTGLQGTGKTTFAKFLETGNWPLKTEPTNARKEYEIKGEFPEHFNIKICSDGESIVHKTTEIDEDALIINDQKELDEEAKRIKDAFIILYFFNVKQFVENPKYREQVEMHMKFYANELEPSGLFSKVKNFVDKSKMFIAVGTHTDECEQIPQEMRKYVNNLSEIKNGIVYGSFKGKENANKLRTEIVKKIAELDDPRGGFI